MEFCCGPVSSESVLITDKSLHACMIHARAVAAYYKARNMMI